MKDLFKIFTILTPKQLRKCVVIVLAMVIGAMLEAVGIGAILPLISVMGQPDFLAGHALIEQYMHVVGVNTYSSFIMFCSAGLILVYILKNIYMLWQNKLQIDFSMKNQVEYARLLLKNYLDKPYLYHMEQNSATLLRNIDSGARSAFLNILIPAFTLLTELITAMTIWIMLIFIDAFTAIIVAGVMGSVLYAILRAFRRSVSRQGQIQNDCVAVYIKWLNQALGSIKETKILQKEDFFLEEFSRAYTKYGLANSRFTFLSQVPKILIEMIVVSGLLLLIIVKLAMGYSPQDIVPLLGVLALAAFRLMPSANRIVTLSNAIKYQMPLFNEIYEDLLQIRLAQMRAGDSKPRVASGRMSFTKQISIRDVSFRYPEMKQYVLENVSFVIPKGTFLGVIGPSGAGKTTFIDILLGLLEPVDGCIFCDQKNIKEDITSWRRNLSYVPQNIYLLDGTIRENIAVGTDETMLDRALLEQVLRMAELYDFVMSLPEQLETQVGEAGVKLSGGQRQRIGIARALYQRPELLVLDEATSALDNETEKSITDTILKLKGQITIIAIAHRISTLADCDFKIKFDNGTAEVLQ